ncbi:MAG: RluA family pseudouridine synthase [Candidatus Algichlamydia australiensis]|nr:RluA family pseudouridine synthase [Chlamydiales bacterium]
MKSLDSEEILYLDNHLLVVNKPAGLLTQPSPTASDSLEERAKAYIKKRFAKPGAVFLHAVHRLDRAVSGIVLFARTSKALSRLQEQQRERKIKKIYYALVDQTPTEKKGKLEHKLSHGSFKAVVKDGGKEAVLFYEVIGKNLLRIELVTGRYHQIRAQLSAIGSPIVGDQKYGSTKTFHSEAIALHHGEMIFSHPTTKEKLSISSRSPFQKSS